MDSPNTPSRPPLYSEPPFYGEENSPTPTGQPSNQSQVRLLTSVDEPNTRPYVPKQSVQRPKATHFVKLQKKSSPEHLATLREEEERISSRKVQKSLEKDITQLLP